MSKMMKFEMYIDSDGDYRWRLRATRNRKILADSAEGYRRKVDCVQAQRRIIAGCMPGNYDFVDLTGK